MKNLRSKIIKALIRVKAGAYSTLTLTEELVEIKDQRDKNLFTEIFYGVIRNEKYLDYIIEKFSNNKLTKLDTEVLMGLRIGLYQLFFLDRIPARAAIYETVEAVKELLSNRGAAAFTNGILRNIQRHPEKIKLPDRKQNLLKFLAIKYSYPEWLVKQFSDEYGPEQAEKILAAGNKRPEIFYRFNSLKMTKAKFLASLTKAEINYESTFIDSFYKLNNFANPAETEVFKQGAAYIQGIAAGLAALLLRPKPGMKILDLAAAPGGKTTHIAQLTSNQAQITALDLNPTRLELVRENILRLGAKQIKLIVADAANYQDQEQYDRILADLPCSGLGLIAAKPEIKWRKSQKQIKDMAELQHSILVNNIAKLKVNGQLLYSTCTLSKAENQLQIERLLSEYDNLELLDLKPIVNKLTNLNIKGNSKYLEILPGEFESEGFFYALIKKNGE